MQAIITPSTETRTPAEQGSPTREVTSDGKMKATVFHGKDEIRVEEVERPRAGVGEAVIRVHPHHDLRHRPPHRARRVPGQAWAYHWS